MNAHQINPTIFSEETLQTLAFALYGRMQHLYDSPMNGKEAMAFLNVSKQTFYNMVNEGKIKGHRLTKNGDPLYLKSEILESIKRS